jgi:polyferredoxin
MAIVRTRQKVRKGLILLLFVLFPVVMNFLSPYLILCGAAQGIASGSFLFFGLLLVSSLFLGRAFCGWICPGGGAQEACFPVNDRPVRGRRLDWIKYLVWAPWLAAIAWLFARAGGVRAAAPGYRMDSWVSVDSPGQFITYYFVLGLIMIVAAAAGRRAMCHSLCWMAPFMIVGRKLRNALRWPALRLEARAEGCIQCGSCTKGCPMSLAVHEKVRRPGSLREAICIEDAECILCGSCVDNCPRQVIRYRFVAGR